MAVIVLQTEMGKVCLRFQNVQDYHIRKEKACENPQGCLMCKAFDDTYQIQKLPITSETTIGMT
eukprot:12113802-Heterocapsa_arctica.AAC.1